MPTESDEIAVKDTVVFKNAGRDAAHWIVEHIGRIVFITHDDYGRTPVRLLSGRTGLHRAAFLDELELFRSLLVDPSTTHHESLAHHNLVSEMVAEGMVEHVAEVLVAKFAGREFMVEVTMFEITEERV